VTLLDVQNLRVSLPGAHGALPLLHGVSFSLPPGGTLGLIGESGSGKSLTALALMGLLPEGARLEGSMRFEGRELATLAEAQWCALRGSRMAMVFQEPMTALNPLHTVGHQVAEPLRLHQGLNAAAARAQALRLLGRVQLPNAAQRLDAYPHQLSGGQRQRVMLATALACAPALLIADEPTTALDTTLQREVLDLIAQLVREDGMGLILISHDLDVVADRVQQVLVMREGAVVESGSTRDVFERPQAAYTRALQAARPRLGQQGPARATANAAPLLVVEGVSRHYRPPRTRLLQAPHAVQALSDIHFTLQPGRSLGVVGVSGSGKSTLARIVMALDAPTSGRVLLGGADLHRLPPPELRRARRQFQMVFQDPFSSLDPRRTVLQTVAEPLAAIENTRIETQRAAAAQALEAVGLRAADLDKFPHEFSGGQRQRIAIARALITRPALIVADEPVSALDVSVQAQVLALLRELQRTHGIAFLFISHDLAVVDNLCDEVLVLDQGRVVELGPPQRLFTQPQHATTRGLLAAMPGAASRRISLPTTPHTTHRETPA